MLVGLVTKDFGSKGWPTRPSQRLGATHGIIRVDLETEQIRLGPKASCLLSWQQNERFGLAREWSRYTQEGPKKMKFKGGGGGGVPFWPQGGEKEETKDIRV